MTENKSPVMGIDLSLPEDLQTLDASQLGKLLGRSTKSIKMDVFRRPESLPPRWMPPGYKRHTFLWRVVDVRAWMQALADLQADERKRAAEFARKQGITGPLSKSPYHLGRRDIGTKATKAQKGEK